MLLGDGQERDGGPFPVAVCAEGGGRRAGTQGRKLMPPSNMPCYPPAKKKLLVYIAAIM